MKPTPLQLIEAQILGGGAFFDPLDELFDPISGDRWLPLNMGQSSPGGLASPQLQTEQGLWMVRSMVRYLTTENGFALNAIGNLQSYTVGTGMRFTVVPRKGKKVTEQQLAAVQAFVDDFADQSEDEIDEQGEAEQGQQFGEYQLEWVERRHRDGEVFTRFFPQLDGTMQYRFVEPEQVRSNPGQPADTFGIRTAPGDVTTPIGYWIDGDYVDASLVAHEKANVDRNVKRGVPTLWPIRQNLHRAAKLQKNMSVLAQYQASILMVRKHGNTSPSQITSFADDKSDYTRTDPLTSRQNRIAANNGSRVIDTSKGMELEFPTIGVNAGALVEVLRAELRAAAARLRFTESMFTADASNANLASSIVAEGPTHRMFRQEQATAARSFVTTVRRACVHAEQAGFSNIPSGTMALVQLKVTSPQIETRDGLKDTQVNQIMHSARVLSARTWQQRAGLDPITEEANLEAEGVLATPDDPETDKGDGE